MGRYAAFLRGINVGTAHRVGGAELRSCLEGIGLRDVATFRASGNLAFEADDEPPAELAARIEAALEAALGYDVAVFLRAAGELRAIAAHEPFERKLVEGSKGKLQVTLLAGRPAAKVRRQALSLATDEDRLAFGGRELYWLPSGGTQTAALDRKALDALLGPTTMRTKGTIEQMAAKYFGD